MICFPEKLRPQDDLSVQGDIVRCHDQKIRPPPKIPQAGHSKCSCPAVACPGSIDDLGAHELPDVSLIVPDSGALMNDFELLVLRSARGGLLVECLCRRLALGWWGWHWGRRRWRHSCGHGRGGWPGSCCSGMMTGVDLQNGGRSLDRLRLNCGQRVARRWLRRNFGCRRGRGCLGGNPLRCYGRPSLERQSPRWIGGRWLLRCRGRRRHAGGCLCVGCPFAAPWGPWADWHHPCHRVFPQDPLCVQVDPVLPGGMDGLPDDLFCPILETHFTIIATPLFSRSWNFKFRC